MEYDEAGFRYPVINYDKCIVCHLCERTCPSLKNENIDRPYKKTYAGYSDDKNLLLSTSSGGFATALSKLFLEEGGRIAGVRLSHNLINSEYNLASTVPEIKEFACSKYVQSEKNGIFKNVLNSLKSGEKVLFIGCPCDVAGLVSFIGDSPKDNLLTCELVCMGVTSPIISKQFIQYAEKKYKSKVVSFNARSKKLGWFVSTLELKFESGKFKTKPLYGTYFGRGFLIYNRPSCFYCKYRGTNGAADLRIGDFWGIKKSDPYWNKDGVSCIFARTQKGIEAIEKLKENNFSLFEVDYKEATDNNTSSTKNKGKKYIKLSERFKDILLTKGLIEACEETSNLGFKLKRILPGRFQPILKQLYHSLRDK